MTHRIKTYGTLILLSLLLPQGLLAATAVPAAQLWNHIQELQKIPEPKPERVDNKTVYSREYFEGTMQRSAAIGDALMEFVEKYPADSRHWEAVAELIKLRRSIYKEIGDVETEGWQAAIRDETAEQTWSEKIDGLAEEMRDAPGASAEQRELAYDRWVNASRSGVNEGTEDERAAVLVEFRRRIDAMRKAFPDARGHRIFEWQYLNRLRNAHPDAVMAYLEKTAQDPNADIAGWARGELATEMLREEPIELAFTAVDGRKVDMAELRGKVVLVDFWATWCGPCVAELPNVLEAYNKYNGQGFEVVAISLDRKDDRQKLVDFVAERKLPWPQYFDGENEKNAIAEQYGVMAIPAMFLFDKSGRLVTTDARGEKLGPEIERLLGS